MDKEEVRQMLQDEAMKLPDLGIVVSGISGRYPKADSVNEFEDALFHGKDMVTDKDSSRFESGLWNLPPRHGRLKDITKFDNEFFNISDQQANETDHQLRILYEVVYEAIIDAGVNTAELRGSNTGVYVGLHTSEFEQSVTRDMDTGLFGYFSQLGPNVAKYFDFRGCAGVFATACASVFTALNAAVTGMTEGLIEQAIVAGVNIPINPTGNYWLTDFKMTSPNGYCYYLDARANGYVRSEACVAVLLQKKAVALRNYCSILVAVSGADGFTPDGITTPSCESQASLIEQANALTGVTTNHIEYIEAHGTGTPVGDPIESEAIASVYFKQKNDSDGNKNLIDEDERKIGPLLIGSVKSNMGHGEGASGLCALTKVVLMLENELIYKSLHFEKPNPNIKPLMEGKLKPVVETQKLVAKTVPICNYGFGGANCHVIVRSSGKEAIGSEDHIDKILSFSPRLIVMFGRSEESVNSFFDSLLDEKSRHTQNCLSEDCLALIDSLNKGKIDRLMNYRGYLVVDRSSFGERKRELARQVQACHQDQLSTSACGSSTLSEFAHVQDAKPRKCNLIFPGLGSQWPKMAKHLMNCKPFWSTIERLSRILAASEQKADLIHLMTTASAEELKSRRSNHPVAIIAYEIALINIIRDQLGTNNLGGVVGHSFGEIACAYAVGLLDERQAILVAYRLGKILGEHSEILKGKMVALELSEHKTVDLLKGYQTLRVSCVNGPSSVTISGRIEEVDKFCSSMVDKVRFTLIESSSVALHNETIMTQDVKNLLRESILEVLQSNENSSQEHSLRWYSSVDMSSETNNLVQGDAEYFVNCLCKRVVFDKAIERLEDDSVALELGPSGIFGSQLRQFERSSNHPQEKKRKLKFHYVRLMQRGNFTNDQQVLRLLRGIGDLYLCGITFSSLTQFNMNSKTELEELFPVRRQTPSLSSLFRWRHDKSFFVPRYPMQFGRSLSATSVIINLNEPDRAYIQDHQVEGRIIFPATGYLLLIWRQFSRIKIKNESSNMASVEDRQLLPIEFRDVQLFNACVLSKEHPSVLLLNFELATGRFQFLENDNLLVQGTIRRLSDSSSGLLYEETRSIIEGEKPDPEGLRSEDIYKHFRVIGYDYGETFQNIVSSSHDGRHLHVKYSGYFDSFTDSILQSLLLAMKHNGSGDGILVPTGFEYVRFQPSAILKKLSETGTPFSMVQTDKSLEKEMKNNQDTKSLFDVFCDPLSGVIITDGIEMKGVQVTLAPRRSAPVLLEKYQFVSDIEDPICDISIDGRDTKTSDYVKICNSIALTLLAELEGEQRCHRDELDDRFSSYTLDIDTHSELFGEKYLKRFLTSIWDESGTNEEYNIKRNGDFTLLSILDQLSKASNIDEKRQLVDQFSIDELYDHIQLQATKERLVRSPLETVIENMCKSESNLRILEIHRNKNPMKDELSKLMGQIEPSLSLDYKSSELVDQESVKSGQSHVHDSEIDRLLDGGEDGKITSDRDLMVLRDSSYTSIPISEQSGEEVSIRRLLSSLANPLIDGGFMMIFLRQEMTLAERILIVIKESDMFFMKQKNGQEMVKNVIKALNQINKNLEMRCRMFLNEARRENLMFISKKSDKLGSAILLFRKMLLEEHVEENNEAKQVESRAGKGRTLIRVRHNNREQISDWLEKLKANFNASNKEAQEKNIVWLCGIETRQQCVSGVVGMMQALRKELGSQRLRCFYDAHTFKQCDEPVSVDQIEQSENFRRALERDLLWNCVDAQGNFGSFRHFTVNEYFNHEECLCSNNPVDEEESQHNVCSQETEDEMMSDGNTNKNVVGTYVNYSKRGDLSSFSWYELPLKHFNDNEGDTICRVAYAALNFKDIMLATGRLSLDSIPIELAAQDCVIGFEFSGLDSNNRRVMGMVPSRAIATHVICHKESSLLVEVPDWMSLKEAATIPVVYATAIMAMIYRGKMQRGESILIHAGSGGVGQAAIRLAAHYGLTIYTTVGTEEKRKFLLEEFGDHLSEERIFSSRDCKFEEGIMKQTGGVGVDLVLNSLSDEKLRASVRCLSDGGRFLEIGKYDMSVNSTLELPWLDTNKTFHGISLDKLFDSSSVTQAFDQQVEDVFRTLKDGLELGFVKPIKHVIFKRDQIEEAFRYMATGSHIGKVLIEIDTACDKQLSIPPTIPPVINYIPRSQLSSLKTYIVTGGLGGFGLELIKWLVIRGASRFVITSRSGIRTSYQNFTLEKLATERNAVFIIVDKNVADTSSLNGVEKLFNMALDTSPIHQIGGVFHLAMILKDSLLDNMSAEDFELVCKPKVDTCIHMDRVSRSINLDIDYFVAFSSVTSGKGNIGQANYAYANSCLERICERRRADGLHGLAIQWGAIGDVGVVYENLGGNDVVIGGTLPQRMPSCMETLSLLLSSPLSVCLSVVSLEYSSKSTTTKGDLISILLNILGIRDVSKVAPSATLGELGLDSLMAVEIRQYLQREFDLTLNPQDIRNFTLQNMGELTNRQKTAVTESASSTKLNDLHKQLGISDNREQFDYRNNSFRIDYRSFLKQNLVEFPTPIILPKEKFSLLNCSEMVGRSLRPIFFIPPLHGTFEELYTVCSLINRPCIGINWTNSFSQARNMKQLVEIYVQAIESIEWKQECNLDHPMADNRLEVDLVGYSFGATVAFEVMVQLKQSYQLKLRNCTVVTPAHLVLLDGSPRELECLFHFLTRATDTETMSLERRTDETIVAFTSSKLASVGIKIDYDDLFMQLSQKKLEEKFSFASERFIDQLKNHSTYMELPINHSISEEYPEADYKFILEDTNAHLELAQAMLAFVQRFMLASFYQVSGESLGGNCTLIRAQERSFKILDDLLKDKETCGLREIVSGKVQSFTLQGDHKSFLKENSDKIAKLICNNCELD